MRKKTMYSKMEMLKKQHVGKLEKMFLMQLELQQKLGYDPLKYDQRYFELMYIGCIAELNEMLENTPWKPWKKRSKLNKFELTEEVIDLWHFVINITMICGITPGMLFLMFEAKNNTNNKRQENGY